MSYDNLGDRIKGYESVSNHTLTKRTPVIMRIDGKAFHTWTKSIRDPFCEDLRTVFLRSIQSFLADAQNSVFTYHQSDEISILFNDWKDINTETWFDNKIQKMSSVGASLFTGNFNHWKLYSKRLTEKPIASFDCRVFNIPKEEVVNYFIWRQQDATRNSIQTYARNYFSHKQLHGIPNTKVIEMLDQNNTRWEELDTWKKRGTSVYRDFSEDRSTISNIVTDHNIPIFTEDRNYIERHL